ncbi:MAG: hypothetical protein KC503_02465 [Myxococcales bacterium]|nr:hypothetical protein [Myxococcales bacterium]
MISRASPSPIALTAIALVTSLAVVVGGCGDATSYELSWTIGCATPGDAACTISSVRQCSELGVDAIAARAVVGTNDEGTARFPCFDQARGSASAVGPDLPGGEVTLEVSALSASGHVLSGPVSVQVVIPGEGTTPVSVDLPAPLACADGVDNDGDGLVDLLDPDCADDKGDSESPAAGAP